MNIEEIFLVYASNFLACPNAHVPFIFLGIPMGENPQRRATWESFLVKLRSRLSLWRGKHISFEGRLVLINVVLNAVRSFSFLFCSLKFQKLFCRRLLIFRGHLFGKRGSTSVELIRFLGRIYVNLKLKVDSESKTVSYLIWLY